MIPRETDVLIVGAGPAGLAAGIETSRRGLRTILLDENPTPGGRIWQALEARGAGDADEQAGLTLIGEFAASGAEARYGASVWGIEDDTVFWTRNGAAHSLRTRRILLATGTTERPMPIPGWTLPGVMTVGAAQIALKTGGLTPGSGTWIAGQGPLTLLYAVQAISKTIATLAPVLTITAPQSMPALYWAYLFYGDASRAQEIADRNDAVEWMQIGGEFQILSS